jgi:N-formylglutamate deformylase
LTDFVIHVPHSSSFIPAEERDWLLPDDFALAQELLLMTDAWTDLLAEGIQLPAVCVVFPVSRLVVDVERFPEDELEPMAAKGMGAVYTRLSTGEPLRRPDSAERDRLMGTWYYPHHARLTQAVDLALGEHGHCLIIDVHSFPSHPFPHEPDQAPNRPEICIGFDTFHTPFTDEGFVLGICSEFGFHAEINRPFAGSIVPTKHYGKNPAVKSMMIEIRRDIYMSETRGDRLPDFDRTAAQICRMIEALAKRPVSL